MAEADDRRYGIAEVSRMVGVAAHVLRQWESRFPQLKPKRDRAKRRYYQARDIEIARRIKQLVRHDKLTTEGAIKQLNIELYGVGRPKTKQEVIDLLDKMEAEVRGLMELLESQ